MRSFWTALSAATIQLNPRSRPMLRRSIKLFLALLLSVSAGCARNNSWTWQKWLEEVSLQGGFSAESTNALEDLESFNLLDISAFDKHEQLSSSMVLYTYECVLDEVENVPVFLNSEKLLSDEMASEALSWLVDELNDFGSESKAEVIYRQIPLKVNLLAKKDHMIQVSEHVAAGHLIEIDHQVYEVVSVDEKWIEIKELDDEDIQEMDLEGSISFNPSAAMIVVKDEILNFHEFPSAGNSTNRLSKTFEAQGFQVRISTSSDSLHIYASKKMDSGVPVFVQFDINQIRCSFKWKKRENEILASALKVMLETSLTSGLRSIDYEDRVLDFSKVEKENLFESLKNGFVKKSDVLEESIELAEIHLPFPEFPACVLKMKVLLHMYASGKAEIAFESDHEFGFEKINDKFRWINEAEKESYASLRASAKASTKLQFILSVLNKDCMDAAAELGIQGVIETRLTKDDGTSASSLLPYELLEDVAHTDSIAVCADLDVYWLMNLLFNSNLTVLGSMGFQKTFEVLDGKNASLFGKKVHLEHFQIVDKCTRKNTYSSDLQISLNTDRIELKQYLLILEEGKTELIQIRSFPDGIMRQDVIYESKDESIASVSSSGKVSAKKPGETVVTVSSKDGLYTSQCSVFVK